MTAFREGCYFSMPAEEYHAVPALSSHGMGQLRKSTYDFWVRSPLNPERDAVLAEEGPSSEALSLGQAFDVRITEGKERFDSLYAEKPEPVEGEDWLITCDDIKARLKELGLKVGGGKADLIARLFEAEPNAKIWDHFAETHREAHSGKTFLDWRWIAKIEKAARLIEGDPTFSKAFTGGAAQVSIFWTCPIIGVPCKARIDYLKPKAIIDLKTILLRDGMPFTQAINLAIARYRYHIQAEFYREAAGQVAEFVKSGQYDAPAFWGEAELALKKGLEANHPKTWLWVFQSKGPAPIVYGKSIEPADSENLSMCIAARAEIETMKMTFKQCLDIYGPDTPWIEPSRIERMSEGDIPPWAM